MSVKGAPQRKNGISKAFFEFAGGLSKLIYKQIENHKCKTDYFSGVRSFWLVFCFNFVVAAFVDKYHVVSVFMSFFKKFLLSVLLLIFIFCILTGTSSTQSGIQNPVEYLGWSFFAKIINAFQPFTILSKRLYFRCSTEF